MLSQQDIRNLKPTDSEYKRGCGNGLYIVISKKFIGKDGTQYGGGKYFKGKYKGSYTHVGTFGNRYGELSLNDASEEWNKIKEWSKRSGQKVSRYKEHQQLKIDKEQKTLEDAINIYLEDAVKYKWVKPYTLYTYRQQLHNHVLKNISPTTPLKDFQIENDGILRVNQLIERIQENTNGSGVEQARRCKQLLKQILDHARSGYGWIIFSDGDNPCKTNKKFKDEDVDHHPTLSWEEVPELIRDINLNKSNCHIQRVLATKFLLMTFLRTGALVRLQWDWIKTVNGVKCFEIPATTSGLKRKKKHSYIPHHVPITSQMEMLLDKAKIYSNNQYIFQSIRGLGKYPHLEPSGIQKYLIKLGYKGRQRAHGWRRTARTQSVELLGIEEDLIKRQMGWIPENKVDKAYNQSFRLKGRKEYLDQWCDLLVKTGLEL